MLKMASLMFRIHGAREYRWWISCGTQDILYVVKLVCRRCRISTPKSQSGVVYNAILIFVFVEI